MFGYVEEKRNNCFLCLFIDHLAWCLRTESRHRLYSSGSQTMVRLPLMARDIRPVLGKKLI